VLTAPLILTATMDPAAHAYFDRLRTAHFPPERLKVGAHLTLFHLLPPSAVAEVERACAAEAAATPVIEARASALRFLGRGVAFVIDAPALAECRTRLADRFAGLLSAQDQAPFRPHVTVMNKAEPAAAKRVLEQSREDFEPFPVAITGLALWRYLGGPWEAVRGYRLRG